MDKRIMRGSIAAAMLFFLALAPSAVSAQAALEPTQIIVGAPSAPDASGRLRVQAVLADGKGHPISKAVIYFTTSSKFLGHSGDVVLAQAVTNAKGQAVADFTEAFSGTFSLQAEFRGDAQYAPSSAASQVGVSGTQQVYDEHVGVDLPGFNVPPGGAPLASMQSSQGSISGFIQNLWPAMNGWPVAAILLLVWSTYFFAVTFVFRVAGLAGEDEGAPSTERRAL